MKDITPFDIVNTPINNGQFLIEASAGTGKTYAIANIYLRLLLERSLHPSEILVVTFTVPATAELRDRLRTNLKAAYNFLTDKESREDTDKNVLDIIQSCLKQKTETEIKRLLHKTLLDFDEAAIFTIHSFCMHMLAENAFESGALFDVEMIKDQSELVDEVVEDYWRCLFYNSSSLSGVIKSLKISIDDVKKAAYFIVKNPDILFLPEDPPDISLEELCSEINEQMDSIVGYWKKNKTSLINAFESIPLKMTSHRDDFGPIINDFTVAVEQDTIYSEALYKIRNFTEDGLTKGCTVKGKEWEPKGCLKEFIALCAELDRKFNQFALAFKYWLYNEFKHTKKLSEKKKQLGVRSYIDLLTEMRDGLCTNGRPDPGHPLAERLRKQFKAALIDEFQDTDPIQFEIFTTVFDHSDSIMFMIGDPKQSIYRFRGADIFAYLKAKNNPDIIEYTLDTNHRTIEPLVNAVDQWFNNESSPGSFVYDKLKYNGVKAADDKRYSRIEIDGCAEQRPFELYCSSAPNKQIATNETALHTAYKIAELMSLSEDSKVTIVESGSDGTEESRRPVTPKDIAVLVRKNTEAEIIHKALTKVNVPSVIRSTGNVFKTEEALDVLRVLEAISEKGNSKKLNTALCGKLIGLTPSDIYQMTSCDDSSEYEYWLELFSSYKAQWEEKGFIRMFHAFLEPEQDIEDESSEINPLRKKNVKANVLSNGGGERSLTNILHIGELIHKESVRSKLGIDAIIQWLFDKISSDKIEAESEEYEIRLDTDAEAVQIITIHSSKGLQYPIVFCPYLWTKGISPSNNELRSYAFHKDGKQYCDLADPKSHKAEVEKENLAEEIRLMYVAMTRTVYRLYIYYTDIKGGSSKQTAIYYLLNAMINGKSDMDTELSMSSVLKGVKVELDRLNLINGRVDFDSCDNIERGFNYIRKSEIDLTSEIFTAEKLADRTNIIADWGVMSYSSLIDGNHKSDKGDEQSFGEVDASKSGLDSMPDIRANEIIEHPETSFFHFPRKGKFTGSFCHEILEIFKFDTVQDEGWKDNSEFKSIVEIKLRNYGLINGEKGTEDYSRLLDVRYAQVFDMLNKVLLTPISEIDNSFNLSLLNDNELTREMEFYYPVNKRIEPKKINAAFSKYSFKNLRNDKSLNSILDNAQIHFKKGLKLNHGYMTGSIDLVFTHQGRYYIGDWKGSWLGSEYSDYSKKELLENMAVSGYFLQHNLYAVALYNFLKTKIKDYNKDPRKYYNDYFGGIFYFYIRGMNGVNSDYGYIFDKPEFDHINSLSKKLFML